jgi:hypothetical protein
MPGWLKVLLIVFLLMILAVVGIVAAAGFWFYRNKDALMAKTKAIATEAKNFGESTDNQGCVNETVSRYKAEPGLTSTISNSIFMRICLDASRATPGFCDDVPKPREFIKTAQWKRDQCHAVDLDRDSNCQNLFTPVQQFCEERQSR